MRAKVTRIGGHHFRYSVRGMEGAMDVALPDTASAGPSPKELALASLCGCTGTDVIDLLAKFKIEYESFELEARANLTEKHPKVFAAIELNYTLAGAKGDLAQVAEAVKRSSHQYSGMMAMLSKACPIQYSVKVNGDVVATGQAEFS